MHCSILALQFEPSPESVLDHIPDAPGMRKGSPGAWTRSRRRLELNLLHKWFLDLDDNSSTSWCSLQSNSTAFQNLNTQHTFPLMHEPNVTQTSVLCRPPGPRSSRSVRQLHSHEPALISGKSTPNSLEDSFDQLIHANNGDGLFLMCKRGIEAETQASLSVDSLEALPQCDPWDSQALSAPSSHSSHPVLLYPRSDAERESRNGGMSDTWKDRLSRIRKRGSHIFKMGQ